MDVSACTRTKRGRPGLLLVLLGLGVLAGLGLAWAADPVARPAAVAGVTYSFARGNGDLISLAMAADGRIFAFASLASDLVVGDRNGVPDVFVYNAATGQINRASLSNDGEEANGPSFDPALSADGRYVAFASQADNLVLGDTNGRQDIFVRDLVTGLTERVSVASGGGQADGDSFYPALSADGRYVVFASDASNLVVGDTNQSRDIFVHDRHTGQTRRVSVSSGGDQADRDATLPAISGDGRYVVFESLATNLVPDDRNNTSDIFLHDTVAGTTVRISVAADGTEADGPSHLAAISADGRVIGFRSFATNLVEGDSNRTWDVFVVERETGWVERVSLASDGTQGNPSLVNPQLEPARPSLSADGRFVAFQSDADNLVPDDTNQVADVFVRDRQTNQTERVSVGNDGSQGQAHAFRPAISGDGRYVAFLSRATGLLASSGSDVVIGFYRDRTAPSPTATPTDTPTATSTPTPTPTRTPTPTPTPTPTFPVRAVLPLVVRSIPLPTPHLAPVDNGDLDNRYTLAWTASIPENAWVEFQLQEATSPDFGDARLVYQGPGAQWEVTDQAPGTYYYRVRAWAGINVGGWSAPQSVQIYPLYVGLRLRWEGTGTVRHPNGAVEPIGYRWEQRFSQAVAGTVVRTVGRQWFEPNPRNWPGQEWTEDYDVADGRLVATSLDGEGSREWGYPWLLPYGLDLTGFRVVSVDGQVFWLEGPLQGQVAGRTRSYWRLVNRDPIVFWDDGAGSRQVADPGQVELWYAAQVPGLLLHAAMAYRVEDPEAPYQVQYAFDLVSPDPRP